MLSICSAILLIPLCQTAPSLGKGIEPSPVPTSWELTLKFLDPKRIEVQLPGESEPRVYWYMVYTVVNRGERTQRFFPTFQIVTEDLRVVDTDIGIHPNVFNAIRERHKPTHKYLISPTEAIDNLKVGEDNAVESVAIWRDFDLTLNSFRVYVAGLSGEVKYIPRPHAAGAQKPGAPDAADRAAEVPAGDAKAAEAKSSPASAGGDDKKADAKFIVLRKTLEISYSLPGSPRARPFVEAQRGDVRWIMR